MNRIQKKLINNKISNDLNIYKIASFKRTFLDVYKISILRTVMNQLLEKLYFCGNVLDIGGGKNANYKDIINCDKYTSINIDKKIKPDYVLKVNEKFPIKKRIFDICLLFNVLEHIYDWNFIFNEIKNVLKDNGQIHIIIPFLYPIHGSPNDFKRVTSEYLEIFLKSNGFKNIKIYPLSYGPFTNSQIVGYRHKSFNGPIVQFSVILDKTFQKLFPMKYHKYNISSPLFYYINAELNPV